MLKKRCAFMKLEKFIIKTLMRLKKVQTTTKKRTIMCHSLSIQKFLIQKWAYNCTRKTADSEMKSSKKSSNS